MIEARLGLKLVVNRPGFGKHRFKEKTLLRFVGKLTFDSGSMTPADIATLESARCDDASICYEIATCALFNFYNRFVSGNGVRTVSNEALQKLSRRMAWNGYRREPPPEIAREMKGR